jgi:hypothetical protein
VIELDFSPENFPYDSTNVQEWEPLHDHSLLKKSIQIRNIRHFGQAQGTPFTIPPLNEITWQANRIGAKEIIAGSIPTKFLSDNPYTNKVLQYIARRENLPEIDTYIIWDSVARLDERATVCKR